MSVRDMLDIKSTSGISWMAFSSLSVTSISIRSGLAPGNRVITVAIRMVNPGSSALGIERYARIPPMSIRIKATAVMRFFSKAARVIFMDHSPCVQQK